MNDDDKPSLSEAIRLLAERDRRSLGAHPKIEELAAYHAGELEPQAEARLREHISVCRECSDLLLDLINFADLTPPPGEPDLTDEEMEQDWQALRARMGEGKTEEPAPPKEVVPIRPAATAPAPKLGRTFSLWLPVAASLLAVLGFSFGLYQSVQLGMAREIRPVDLLDEGERKRGLDDAFRFSAREGTVLHLALHDDAEYPKYEVDVLRDKEVVKRIEVLPKEGARGITLVIPGSSLDPGSYQSRLYGIRGDRRTPLGTLPFEVDDP